jgi:hypothetical protein
MKVQHLRNTQRRPRLVVDLTEMFIGAGLIILAANLATGSQKSVIYMCFKNFAPLLVLLTGAIMVTFGTMSLWRRFQNPDKQGKG